MAGPSPGSGYRGRWTLAPHLPGLHRSGRTSSAGDVASAEDVVTAVEDDEFLPLPKTSSAQLMPHADTHGAHARAHRRQKALLCHCNEIKLLENEFGTDRTARDGHARAARCATPQPEQ
jgi:hypothetical protein